MIVTNIRCSLLNSRLRKLFVCRQVFNGNECVNKAFGSKKKKVAKFPHSPILHYACGSMCD